MLERIIDIFLLCEGYQEVYDSDIDEYGNGHVSRQIENIDGDNVIWFNDEEIGYMFVYEDQIIIMGFNDEEIGDIDIEKIDYIEHKAEEEVKYYTIHLTTGEKQVIELYIEETK